MGKGLIMRKTIRRSAAILLSVLLAAEMAVPSIAAEKGGEVSAPTVSVSQEVLDGNYFYIANDTASFSENDRNTYLFTIGRGGSTKGEADVNVVLRDITALCGENYEAWVVGGEKAEIPAGHCSYVSFMSDADSIEESPVISEEEGGKYLSELTAEGQGKTSGYLKGENGEDLSSSYENTDNAIPPVKLSLHFKEGENVKQVAIRPLKSAEAEGDASFMMALTNPSEEMELSGLNNIMIVIEDESGGDPACVSFEKSAYYVAGDRAYITVTRKGRLNDTVSAYIFTEEDSACGYYDFSPLGANLVFPFGVKSRTVEIPVNHLSDGERSFYVGISQKAGCVADEKSSKVKVTLAPCGEDDVSGQTEGGESVLNENKTDKAASEAAAEPAVKKENASSEAKAGAKASAFATAAKTTGRVFAAADSEPPADKSLDYENTIDLSKVKIVGSGYYQGDKYLKLTTHDINAGVASYFNLGKDVDPTFHSYAYDGYEIYWKLDEGLWFPDYFVSVYLLESKNSRWRTLYRNDDDNNGLDKGTKTRIYKATFDTGYETSIGMVTESGSGNDLYIYSIVPIKRSFDVVLLPAEAKEFKNVSSQTAAQYSAAEINNSKTTKQGVVYSQTMLGDTVTVTATDTNHYLRLAGLYIQDGEGNEITYISNPSSSSDSVSFDMDKDFIDTYGEAFDYELIDSVKTVSSDDKGTHTCYSEKGKLYVKPDFKYRDVDFTILPDDLGMGFFKEFPSTGSRKDWHMGDVVKLTGSVKDAYAGAASVTGAAYRIKKNIQEEAVSGIRDFGSTGTMSVVLDGESVSLRPVTTEKSNALVVRVSDKDYGKFDHTKGIFAGGSDYIKHNDEAGVYEITVIPAGSLVNNQICSIVAFTEDNGAVPVWKEYGNEKSYSGTTFFHEAGSRAVENIVDLSVNETDCISAKLHGFLYYSNVNINTSRQAEGNFPASGQSIGAGGVSAVADETGEFTTEAFNAAKGLYVKYITGSNGSTAVGDAYIGGTENNTGIINVPVQSVGSVSVDRVSVEQGGYYLVNTIPLSGLRTTFRAEVTDDVEYYLGQKKYTEKITAVNFVVLDGTTLERKYIFKGSKAADYAKNKVWECEAGALTPENTSWYGPGDYVYVEIESDRVKAEFGGADAETAEALKGAVYTPQFSGFTLISTDSYETVQLEVGFPISADNLLTGDYKSFHSELGEKRTRSFVTLPYIGGLDTQIRAARTKWDQKFDYDPDENRVNFDNYKNGVAKQSPAVNFQITVEERPNGITRLKIGAAVTYSNAKEENISQQRAGMFEKITGKYNQYFQREASATKASGGNQNLIYNDPNNINTTRSFFGGTSMTFSILVGIYLDFGFVSENDSIVGAEMKFLGLGIYFGISGSIGYTYYFLLPFVTIPGYIGFTGTLAVVGAIGATGSPDNALADQTDSFVVNDFCDNPEIVLNGILNVTGFLGVGLRGIIGVRGTAAVLFVAGVDSSYPELYDGCDTWGTDLTFNLGGAVDIAVTTIPFNIKGWDMWQTGYYKYFEKHKGVEVSGQGGSEAVLKDADYSYQKRTGGSEFTGDDPVLQATYVSEGKASEKEIVNNVYTHPSSKMADIGNGKILMVYLDDDSSKADNQITSLYYTVYDKGFWSTPVKIQNDGSGDFYPNVTDCGDKVLISWASAPDTTSKTDIDRLMDMEIYTAFYDKKKGSVGEITRLTDDIYFDSIPQAVYDEKTDSVALYYTKNAPEMEEDANHNWVISPGIGYVEAVSQMAAMKYSMICYRLYENGQWTEKYYQNEYADGSADNAINKGERYIDVEIKTPGSNSKDRNDPPVADFTAAEGYNGLAVFAYTVDMDSDMESDTDRELFIQIYDFKTHKTYKPIRLTDNGISESMPVFTRSDNTTRLFWLADNNVLLYSNITDLVKYGINSDGSLKATEEEAVSKVPVSEQKAACDYDLSYHKVDLRHRDISMDASSTLDGYTVVSDSEDNLYVIWTNADYGVGKESSGDVIKMEREIYAAAMIDEGNGVSWSDPVKLSDSGKVNDEIAAVIDSSDNLIISSARFDMSFDSSVGENENPVIQGPVDLVTSKLVKAGSVEVKAIELSDPRPEAGDKVEVRLTVKNTGLTAAEGYSVDLFRNSAGGTKIASAKSDEVLLPGCTTTEAFTWTVPEGFDGTKLCAVSKENGFSDAFTYTSEPIRERAAYEVTVNGSRQEGDEFYLDLGVKNVGNKVSDPADVVETNIICLYGHSFKDFGLDSEKIGQVKIGNALKPGESSEYSIKLGVKPEAFNLYGFIDVSVRAGAYGSDGTFTALSRAEETFINQTAPTDLSLDITTAGAEGEKNITVHAGDNGMVKKDGAAAKGDFSVKSGAGIKLSHIINGIPEANGIVTASSDEGVVRIENGRIFAVGEGDAEITATVLPYGTCVSVPVTVGEGSRAEGFTDVAAGSWYADAVEWAVENGITKGISPTLFSPDTGCTRAQAVTFLWRAAGCPEAGAAALKFSDVKAGSYYEDAVAWAVSEGITEGVSETRFDPDAVCTRGHIVTFLWRAAGSPELKGEKAAFTDVKEGLWFTDAVYWAAENKITTGMTETLFVPDDKCTRAQIVTFLWRSKKA